MQVITNNNPRALLSGFELTPAECKELDYIENIQEESARFFRYRGQIYDTHEFQHIVKPGQTKTAMHDAPVSEDSPLIAWDYVAPDSYFSGTVFRFVPDSDFEQIIAGRYFS